MDTSRTRFLPEIALKAGTPLPALVERAAARAGRWIYRTAALRLIASFLMVLSSLPLSLMLPPTFLFAPDTAYAASFTVNTTNDTHDANLGDSVCADSNNDCSLRAALEEGAAVSGSDTMTLPAGTYTLTLGELVMDSTVNITGAGASTTIIDGGGASRVLKITRGSATISGVTIRNGSASDGGGGVALVNTGGTVSPTVQNAIITSNATTGTGDGGGISVGASTSLTLTNVTVSSNTSADIGGGIANSGTLTLTGSTISGNTAASNGGGIANLGGTITLGNSTVSGNTSSSVGGGLYTEGTNANAVTNVTVSGNSGTQGGGINVAAGGAITVKNTIIANSTGGDCSGALTSQGYNLIEDTTGCTISGVTTGNVTGQDPALGALASNGGTTQTHAITSSSPAFNAGDNSACAAAPVSGVDQRGITRPQGATCDIGAFELELSSNADLSGLALSAGTLSPAFAAATTSYTATVGVSTSSITVTPTAADSTATIQVRVNSGSYSAVTSGSASGALALNVGSNTVDVLVTAQGGTTTKTYTVTVTRSTADFVVNSTADAVDASAGDGVCATAASECTLRAAIQEANALDIPGITISVPAGTYSVSGELTVTAAGTTISGPGTGAGISRAVVQVDGCQNRLFQISASNVTLSGLEIVDVSGGCARLVRLGDYSSSSSITVSGVTVSGNVIHGGYRGVNISPYSSSNTISGNEIYGTSTGIHIDSADSNTVQNNTVRNNSSRGIDIEGNWDTAGDNQILNNTVSSNSDHGIRVDGTSNTLIQGNTVSGSSDPRGAIEVQGSTGTTVAGNIVQYNSGPGIKVGSNCCSSASGTVVRGNLVRGNSGYGIRLNSGAENTTVHRNALLQNTTSPQALDDGTGNVWHFNDAGDGGDKGNYYSDYSGADANSDGIGDTAYTIQGTAINNDPLPLMTSPVTVITLNPTAGLAGATVTVSGIGYSGVSSVQIDFDSTQVGTATPDASGNFSQSVTVPAGASAGSHTITAHGGSKSATATFQVAMLAVINVDNTDDIGDRNPGDGVCDSTGEGGGGLPTRLLFAGEAGLCTLRAAIEEANASSNITTINVPAGTYTISSELTVTAANTTISGPGIGTGISRAVVEWDCASHIFQISASNVTLSGLEIANAGGGHCGKLVRIGDRNSGTTVTGVTVSGNIIRDGYHGLLVSPGSSNITVENNEIYGNRDRGIHVDGANNSIIQNNIIRDNRGHGIRLASEYSNSTPADGITITGNTLLRNGAGSEGAIELAEGSRNVTVTNNTVMENNGPGIKVGSSSDDNTVTGSVVRGNAILNNSGIGIRLNRYSQNTTVHRNAIIGNAGGQAQDNGTGNVWHFNDAGDGGDKGNYYSDYSGADADSDGIGDTAYAIARTETGTASSDPRPLVKSPVVVIVVSPVTAAAGETVQIIGYGYPAGSVDITFDGSPLTTATASATGNFTASVAAPSATHGSHTVTAASGSATATASLFIGVMTTFNVTDTASTGDAAIGDGICDSDAVTAGEQCTLRAAVDEANGRGGFATINIAAGSYTLAAELRLTGPRTSLIGPGTGAGITRAVITQPVICSRLVVIDADNATVQGLELVKSDDCKPNVRVGGDDDGRPVRGVTVTGNVITNGNRGVAINDQSWNNTISENTISGATFGVNIKGGISTTVQNNAIIGGEIGIIVRSGASSTLAGNQIVGNTVTGSTQWGIFVAASNGNTVANNQVRDNGNGIFVGYCCPNATGNILTGNQVLNNIGIGIHLEANSRNTTVHRNILGGNRTEAKDDGQGNVWHAVEAAVDRGNFYGDYAGIDANSDGAGDTAHPIPGIAGASDPKPLFWPGAVSAAFIVVTPSQTAPGAAISMAGGGFAATGSVAVQLDSTSLGTATADGDGAFRLNATVPAGTADGSHTVSATDGTATASFTLMVSTPFTVNSQTDAPDANIGDGVCATAASECTLRAAVLEANGLGLARTINVPAGTYTLTIPGVEDAAFSGDLDVGTEISIVGAGAAATILDAGGLDKMFYVQSGKALSLTGVTVRNGSAPEGGAGIYVGSNARLTVTDSVITANTTASGNGGGIYGLGSSQIIVAGSTVSNNTAQHGGGINTDGALAVTNSTFSGNTATQEGGAVSSFGNTLTVRDSTFSGNRANIKGGAVRTGSQGTITSSTFNGNSAGDAGGALINFCCSQLAVTNSTFSANTVDGDGRGGGAIFSDESDLTLTNVTIYGNSAPAGGGIYRLWAGASVVLKNTIVANNGGNECGGPEVANIVSQGHNLSSDTTCNFTQPGDQQGVDPLLGPPGGNGGPTQTHLPQPGSPALNAGDNTGCPATDQRGIARPHGAICDIGAVEVVASAYGAAVATAGVPTTWEFGETKQITVTAQNAGNGAWNASGPNPVVLVVQFRASESSAPITEQVFPLPADLAPGSSHTFSNIAVTAPLTAAGVLHFGMVRQGAAPVPWPASVAVTLAAPRATLDTSNVPGTWVKGKAQTFTVAVTNQSNQVLTAATTPKTLLRARFAGGQDKFFALPQDVPAGGGTASVSVTLTAPSTTGAATVELALVWQGTPVVFGAAAPVAVTVAEGLAGTVSAGNVPATWAVNKAETFTAPVQNTGGLTWTASGADRVLLRGRIGSQPYIYTSLPGSVAPSGTASVSVTLTAPSTTGAATVELALVHSGSGTVFASATVSVTVGTPYQGSVSTVGAPVAFTAGKARSFSVTVSNRAPAGGGATWTTTGPTRVLLRARLGGQPAQYFDLPGSVAPGASATVSAVTVTAPATLGAASLELALVQGGQTTPFATATVSVEVVPALRASVELAQAPAVWAPNRAQSFAVGVSNTALADGAAWSNSGAGRVLVRGRFAGLPWSYVELPAAVAPGGSATVSMTLTAPGATGATTIEVETVVSGQAAGFASASASVTVAAAVQGSIDAAGIPGEWTRGRSPAASVVVSNTAAVGGGVTWTTSGATRVLVRVQVDALPYQYYELPGSVAPGQTASVGLPGLGPVRTAGGPVTVSVGLVQAGQTAPFAAASRTVEVKEAFAGSVDGGAAPAAFTAGKVRTFTVGVSNTAAADGDTWQVEGAGKVVVRASFAGQPVVYGTLAGAVGPGATGSASVTLTAPAALGATTVTLDLLVAGQTAPFATATANVEVVPALRGTITTGAVSGVASGVPGHWTRSKGRTFTVQVENTALGDGATWGTSGAGRVVLRVRFGGGSPLPYQYVDLGSSVGPGATGASQPVTLVAPSSTGSYAVELALLPAGGSTAFATASVTVEVREGLAASISSAGVPTVWSGGQTQTFAVSVTNVGAEVWNAGGGNPVVLVVRFVDNASGVQLAAAVKVGLEGDVGPDGSATLAVTVTAPAALTGAALEVQMHKQGLASIPSSLRVPVTAAP